MLAGVAGKYERGRTGRPVLTIAGERGGASFPNAALRLPALRALQGREGEFRGAGTGRPSTGARSLEADVIRVALGFSAKNRYILLSEWDAGFPAPRFLEPEIDPESH